MTNKIIIKHLKGQKMKVSDTYSARRHTQKELAYIAT